MSITLGTIFQSPSSTPPSAAVSGNLWYQTDTGIWLISAATLWSSIGSGEFFGLGAIPLSGGAFYGLVTATGTNLMPTSGTVPFATSPLVTTRDSVLASMADVSALQAQIQTLINNTMSQVVQSIPTTGLHSSMSFFYGVAGPAGVPTGNISFSSAIAGATYQDGTAVQASDCFGFVTFNTAGATPNDASFTLTNEDLNHGMTWQAYFNDGSNHGAAINYMVIAIKASAT